MSKFDVVIFDYDGTLCDTRAAVCHCIQRTFLIFGAAVPEGNAIDRALRVGGTLEATFARLSQRLADDRAMLDDHIATYRTFYEAEAETLQTPYDGVRDVLLRLHDDAELIVVSNKGADAVRRSLGSYELTGLFSEIIADQPGLPAKPDPAILQTIILPLCPQVDRHRILMVGDTEADIAFARNGGIVSCWARYGYGDLERCRQLAPNHQIDSITELVDLVH